VYAYKKAIHRRQKYERLLNSNFQTSVDGIATALGEKIVCSNSISHLYDRKIHRHFIIISKSKLLRSKVNGHAGGANVVIADATKITGIADATRIAGIADATRIE